MARPNYKLRRLAVLFLVFAGFFLVGNLLAGFFTQSSVVKKVEKGKPVNILVMGIDARNAEQNSRSDTMIVASIDRKTKQVVMVWIPRDTRVQVSANRYDKINSVNVLKGPEEACKVAGKLLDTRIDYYVITNFGGFEKIIDILGGVNIDVETAMTHYDPNPKLSINLSSGPQRLNGAQALSYVRYRGGPTADIGRTVRQQKHQQSKLQLLDLQNFRVTTLIDANIDPPARLFASSDHRKAAVLEYDRSELKIYDRLSNTLRSFPLADQAQYLSWSPDNHKLIVDGTLIISSTNAQPRFKLEGTMGQWLADSHTILYRQGKYHLRKVHSETGRDQEVLSLPGEDIVGFHVDAAGHQLVVFSQPPPNRTTLTYYYNLITGELTELGCHDHKAVWSDNGELLLLMARDYYGEFFPWFYQRLHLHAPASPGEELDYLQAKSGAISPGCFSPDRQFYVLTLAIPRLFYSLPEQAGDLFIKRIGSRTITQITLNQTVSDPVWIDK
jgi:LCP family protein required for cell wall assembly